MSWLVDYSWLIGMVLILAMVIWVIVKDRDEH